MAKNLSQEQVSQMFNAISPTYDRVNRVLSFGLDRLWRQKLVKHLPVGDNLRLLDLATGTCDQLLSLMQSQKFSYGLGIDLAEEMLSHGKKKIEKTPFRDKVELLTASALNIPVADQTFDCVTISFGIRNVADPLNCLKEIKRVLSPNGRVLVLEFSLPKNRFLKGLHLFYMRKILPLIGGLISGKKGAYVYLNETIESFLYGDDFIALMKEAGFSKSKALPLNLGIATLYVGESL